MHNSFAWRDVCSMQNLVMAMHGRSVQGLYQCIGCTLSHNNQNVVVGLPDMDRLDFLVGLATKFHEMGTEQTKAPKCFGNSYINDC